MTAEPEPGPDTASPPGVSGSDHADRREHADARHHADRRDRLRQDPASVAGGGREAYAGLVSRLLALAVDAVLLAVAVPVVGVLAPGLWGAVAGPAPEWLRVASGVLAGVLPFAYFWLCWCTAGRTAGGLLLGTAVRRPDGGRVRAPRAAARAILGLLFAPVALAGMLLTVVDPHRRALHDLLLRTVVRRT
jgi:uncharacterized RDD family membrane protein YckC